MREAHCREREGLHPFTAFVELTPERKRWLLLVAAILLAVVFVDLLLALVEMLFS